MQVPNTRAKIVNIEDGKLCRPVSSPTSGFCVLVRVSEKDMRLFLTGPLSFCVPERTWRDLDPRAAGAAPLGTTTQILSRF